MYVYDSWCVPAWHLSVHSHPLSDRLLQQLWTVLTRDMNFSVFINYIECGHDSSLNQCIGIQTDRAGLQLVEPCQLTWIETWPPICVVLGKTVFEEHLQFRNM